MMFSYTPHSPKLIAVHKDGAFAGWLEKQWKRAAPSVGGGKGFAFWQAKVDGRDIQASTLTQAKLKIEGKADLVTGRVLAQ